MGFFQLCGCVSTTIWMHHMDANEMHGEKARWRLHKNAMWCFEKPLEVTLRKTVNVQPPTFYLSHHPSKTNKTCRRSKDELTSYILLCWSTSKDLHTSALWKERHELLYLHSYRINNITTVLLQGWFWLWITHEGWCAIKQTKPNQPLLYNGKKKRLYKNVNINVWWIQFLNL